MYNYFADEKKKKEKAQKLINDYKESKLKEKRKKHVLPEFANNYDARIKNFIFEMAVSKHPITVNDYKRSIESTREELLKEEDEKIKGRRGMIHKGFLTEKERIKQHLIQNQFLSEDSYKDPRKDNKFIQPQMRFKPRTDLERIYDSINSYSYGRINKDIINKQLKSLELNEPEVYNTIEEEEDFDNIKAEHDRSYERQAINHCVVKGEKNKYEQKKIKGRKYVDNSEAKNLMKEYHNKTHFKGATDVSLFCNSSLSPRSRNKMEKVILKNDPEFLPDNEITVSTLNTKIIKKNPLLSEKYVTCETEPNNINLLRLRKMCDSKIEEENEDRRNINVNFSLPQIVKDERNYSILKPEQEESKKKDDEKIVIGEETFLKSELNLITKKVLQKCNYFHDKNKNNNKQLKIGSGKLMITGGLSIAEFANKYNF